MGAEHSSIKKATVFLQGAELTRTMSAEVEAGKNTISIGGLSDTVRPESVTASVSPGATLISAAYQLNHMEEPEYGGRMEYLNRLLLENEDARVQNEDRLSVLKAEAAFLQENQKIGGREGIRLQELKEVGVYYRTRLTEIAEARFAIQKEMKELDEERQRLTSELGSCQNNSVRAVGEIVVELTAETAATVELTVSYFTIDARWIPSYEIRVEDTDSPARLVGKGKIIQTTGEDWSEIEVVLSSGSPGIGSTQPALRPWYLDFQQPVARSQYNAFTPAAEMMMQEEVLAEPPVPAAAKMRSMSKAMPAQQQAQTSIEFSLPQPVSVPSLDKGITVDILNHQLPAKYQHYSVRKLEKDVFLLVRIQGWEKLSLLQGGVSIFLSNTFVGTTFLDPRRADDVLELSLGRDSGVIVTRVKGKDFTGNSLLGKYTKATREWELTVRNTRQTPVELRMLDQLPVPVNKSISVEPVELSGAEHNTETGELCWIINLKPGQSMQKTVKYAVIYPKGSSISLE